MKKTHLFSIIAMLALTSACDPSDWEGTAPPAPNCTPELCPEEFEDNSVIDAGVSCEEVDASVDSSHNKHGPQGANTVHTFNPNTWSASLNSDWCTYGPCLSQVNHEYYAQQYAITSPEKWKTVLKFSFSWGPADRWSTYPEKVAEVCMFGGVSHFCADLTNHNPAAGVFITGSRSGYVEVPVGQLMWGNILWMDTWLTTKNGWQATKFNPYIQINQIWFTDGP